MISKFDQWKTSIHKGPAVYPDAVKFSLESLEINTLLKALANQLLLYRTEKRA